MSYRSDALTALDAATLEVLAWAKLPKRSISEFRDLVAVGRVNPKIVLRNLAIAEEIAAHQFEVGRLLQEMSDVEIERANSKALPKLAKAGRSLNRSKASSSTATTDA